MPCRDQRPGECGQRDQHAVPATATARRIVNGSDKEQQAHREHSNPLKNTQGAGFEVVVKLRVVSVAEQQYRDDETAQIEPAAGQGG